MFVIPVFAEESAKQIGHTISHSKPMQWQNVDIQIPEAKYKQEVKELEKLDKLVSPLILEGQRTDTYMVKSVVKNLVFHRELFIVTLIKVF